MKISPREKILPHLLSHPKELGKFPRRIGLAVFLQTRDIQTWNFKILEYEFYPPVDMAKTEDGGSNTPGEAKEWANPHHQTNHQHVKVVASTFLRCWDNQQALDSL